MAALDRVSILNAMESFFESDTTLYGSGAYIEYISDDIIKYEQARVGIDKSYKMYLNATRKEKIDVRMGNNVDYLVIITYRIEGLKSNPQTAYQQLDDIDERIEHLCDNEMWEGNNLSSYYTNTECTIKNIEWESSDCDIKKSEGSYKVECEGTIRLEINRVK